MQTVTLPTGAVIKCFEPIESSLVIAEIFQRKVYPLSFSHPVERPVIVDFGANVGMFVHYAKSQYPNAVIHAVEAVPPIAEILAENVRPFGDSVITHQCAIADQSGEAQVNFYPGYSIMSGLSVDAEANEKLLSSCIKQELETKLSANRVVSERHIQAALGGRLDERQSYSCRLVEINAFLETVVATHIDYLKMDVEGSELGIARALTAENWSKIGSIAMEVHEYEGHPPSLPELVSILEGQGFVTSTALEAGAGASRTLMLYGVRREDD
jgi:31-O-methyltransferase